MPETLEIQATEAAWLSVYHKDGWACTFESINEHQQAHKLHLSSPYIISMYTMQNILNHIQDYNPKKKVTISLFAHAPKSLCLKSLSVVLKQQAADLSAALVSNFNSQVESICGV